MEEDENAIAGRQSSCIQLPCDVSLATENSHDERKTGSDSHDWGDEKEMMMTMRMKMTMKMNRAARKKKKTMVLITKKLTKRRS